MTKNFIGVKFNDGTHSVVPSKWISYKEKGMYVSWPSSNQNDEAKKNESPDKQWKLFRASIIVESSLLT